MASSFQRIDYGVDQITGKNWQGAHMLMLPGNTLKMDLLTRMIWTDEEGVDRVAPARRYNGANIPSLFPRVDNEQTWSGFIRIGSMFHDNWWQVADNLDAAGMHAEAMKVRTWSNHKLKQLCMFMGASGAEGLIVDFAVDIGALNQEVSNLVGHIL